MTERYFIQATTLAAQGFCAAAGGATFTPPPRSNSKSISYKRFARKIGTFQSTAGLGRALLRVYQHDFKGKPECKTSAKIALKILPRYLYPTYLGNLPILT